MLSTFILSYVEHNVCMLDSKIIDSNLVTKSNKHRQKDIIQS